LPKIMALVGFTGHIPVTSVYLILRKVVGEKALFLHFSMFQNVLFLKLGTAVSNSRFHISVVITHYRRISELQRAIISVLSQVDVETEILVIDDCSGFAYETDLSLLDSMYENVRFIFNPINLGVQKSRNIGIDASNSHFIAFLDCDDEWESSKLAHQVRLLVETKADICSCGISFVREGKLLYKDSSRRRFNGSSVEHLLINGGHFQTSTLLCSTQVAKHVRFDENVRKFQDWDFVIRADHLGYQIVLLQENLVNYHFGATGQMTTLPMPALAHRYLFRMRRIIGMRVYGFGLVRVVARMYIEVGQFYNGFRLWSYAVKKYHVIDYIGLLKLIRKVMIASLGIKSA
jgi:glycosyltransferase involved in cell wall biosynthesis